MGFFCFGFFFGFLGLVFFFFGRCILRATATALSIGTPGSVGTQYEETPFAPKPLQLLVSHVTCAKEGGGSSWSSSIFKDMENQNLLRTKWIICAGNCQCLGPPVVGKSFSRSFAWPQFLMQLLRQVPTSAVPPQDARSCSCYHIHLPTRRLLNKRERVVSP